MLKRNMHLMKFRISAFIARVINQKPEVCNAAKYSRLIEI